MGGKHAAVTASDDVERVVRNVADARAALSVSNRSALNAARVALESICKYIARREGIELEKRASLESLLSDVQKFAPGVVVKDMRVIQLYGNLGSHDDDAQPAAYHVTGAFNALSAVTRWFVTEYLGDPEAMMPLADSGAAEQPVPRLRTDEEELSAVRSLRRDIASLRDASAQGRPRLLAAVALARHVAARLVERHLRQSSRGMGLADLGERLRRHQTKEVPLKILHALETVAGAGSRILDGSEELATRTLTSGEADDVATAAETLGDWFEHDYLQYSRWPGRIARVSFAVLFVVAVFVIDRYIARC